MKEKGYCGGDCSMTWLLPDAKLDPARFGLEQRFFSINIHRNCLTTPPLPECWVLEHSCCLSTGKLVPHQSCLDLCNASVPSMWHYGGYNILPLPKTYLVYEFPLLTQCNDVVIILSLVSWPQEIVWNNCWANQESEEISLKKRHLEWYHWLTTDFHVGRGTNMQGSCGSLHEYGDILKIPADLMHLFEKIFIAIHCGKEGKHMAQPWASPSYEWFGVSLTPS